MLLLEARGFHEGLCRRDSSRWIGVGLGTSREGGGGVLGTRCHPPEVRSVRACGNKDKQSCFPVWGGGDSLGRGWAGRARITTRVAGPG